MSILNYFSLTNTAGDDCEPSPKRVRTVDDADSQSPERVRTSADDLGNDHLSENAEQNTVALYYGDTYNIKLISLYTGHLI